MRQKTHIWMPSEFVPSREEREPDYIDISLVNMPSILQDLRGLVDALIALDQVVHLVKVGPTHEVRPVASVVHADTQATLGVIEVI